MIGVFKVGYTIYLCGDNYCLERKVVSLQLMGVSYEEVTLSSATELGILLDAPGKKNAIVMTVQQIAVTSTVENSENDD